MANSLTTKSATTSINFKKQKNHHNHHHKKPLLPRLPDHIAEICLSLVHPSTLYSVCKSWRSFIYAPHFPPFLSIYAILSSTKPVTDQIHHTNTLEFANFDPISSTWQSLPPPPLRILVRHPSFISRNLPVQSVAVSGNLIILAATSDHFAPALPCPLVFNPLSNKWVSGPPLAAPRRWCAAGVSGNAIFMASGIGSHYNHEVARSVERWDFEKPHQNHTKTMNGEICEKYWNWTKMGSLKNGKFSREAIDAVCLREKLYMVNVKGYARKEGAVYDVKNDEWEEMPDGMLAGWRGPAATMSEEYLYVVDELKGVLKKYDYERDLWEEILESEKLQGAEHITATGGRVCVVCSGGVDIVVVNVEAAAPRLWVVDTPPGFQALASHILPRLSRVGLACGNM